MKMPGISLGFLRWCVCASTREFEHINGHHTHVQNVKVLRKILAWKPVPVMGTFGKQEGSSRCEASLGYSLGPCLSKPHQPQV